MSLEIPELDDTSYEELVETAKTRIAARTDEWTDFNPHDPGITILELLAWLADTHIYQADQITDAHRKKYLQLVGIEPTPPQPASVALDVSPTDDGGRLPAGTRLRAVDGDQQAVFETDHPLSVTASSVEAVVVNGHPQTNANNTDSMYYRLFGDDPTAGDWFAVGFDGDPFDTEQLQLFVDYEDGELPEPPTDDDGLFEPSVELCWEYCQSYPTTVDDEDEPNTKDETDTQTEVDDEPEVDIEPASNAKNETRTDIGPAVDTNADWKQLNVHADTTNSLYERGVITFDRPESWEPIAGESDEVGSFGQPADLVWIRCRLTSDGYEIPPQCQEIQTNVVAASHCCEHDEQLTSTDNGPASGATRTYRFEHSPVLSATVTVDGEQWTEVSDFDSSGPTDRHYMLDREAGKLTVGDGQRGVRPPAGASLRASYEAGGGTVGNVSETARWSVDDHDDSPPVVDIEPRGPATGGTEAEPLEAAVDRCRNELQTTQRAVTANEYGILAESTPGVRVARSTVCLPETAEDPVGVVVVPHAPADVQRPTPSEGFRRAVETHLEYHRLLGDRIDVRGPTYAELTVELTVVPAATHTASDARRQIEQHLRSFLDPIRGFDGDGWPFGQSLSETDLRQTVHRLTAVDYIDELTIRTVGDTTVTADGRLLIDESTLFALDGVEIECRESTGGDD